MKIANQASFILLLGVLTSYQASRPHHTKRKLRAPEAFPRVHLSGGVRACGVGALAELGKNVRADLSVGEVDVFYARNLFEADACVTVGITVGRRRHVSGQVLRSDSGIRAGRWG